MAVKNKYQKWIEGDGLTLLEGWARRGLTDEQIAHNIGITPKTLYDWKQKYDGIRNALKNGKEVVDILVENALLQRALGYETEEEIIETLTNGKTRKTVTKKVIQPDVTAQIFWLKNRRPDLWRDKPQYTEPPEKINDGFLEALKESAAKVKDDKDFVEGKNDD